MQVKISKLIILNLQMAYQPTQIERAKEKRQHPLLISKYFNIEAFGLARDFPTPTIRTTKF